MLCKHEVVGSIPSGSTKLQASRAVIRLKTRFAASSNLPPVLYDIVKRRFVRISRPQAVICRKGRSIPRIWWFA